MNNKNKTTGFNFAFVARTQGGLLLIESLFFVICTMVSVYYGEDTIRGFGISFAISAILGAFGLYLGRNASPVITRREGAIVVTTTWVLFSFIGLLPYVISGVIPNLTNAFFETMSGFTTTGASILQDIESLPKSILFWRSLTHWIGGLGIIVITMAILPIFSYQGSHIYTAEVTGLNKEKIHPKLSGTAKRLLGIYLFFTIAGIIALWIAGMGLFDAVNHAFSSISTGGFSTKNASIAYWHSPSIEWIIIVLMVCSGVNLSLYYFLIKGNFKKFFKDEEMRVFLLIIIITTLIITISRINSFNPNFANISNSFRESLFTVSSLLTTTGFCVVDYSGWVNIYFILMLLLYMGGSAGSTAGGIKVIRIVLIFKYCYYEFKRMIHPNAVFPIRYNNKAVKDDIANHMLAFLLMYIIFSLIGAAILNLSGLGFSESISGMVSCMGNVGPGLGQFGPVENYSLASDFAKWFMSFAMLVGRLEIFTVILVFTPTFWKR